LARSVVVVGAGQGGLSAAIHARLRGYEVLVLEARDRVGGKAAPIERDGYRLDPGPSIIILPRIYQEVFKAAGRNPEDYLRFKRLDPFSRIFFEGRVPLDLPADREECLRTLEQEVPEDSRAVRRLMSKLDRVAPLVDETIFRHPYSSLWQLADPKLIRTALPFGFSKTYKQMVDESFQSPLLKAFFYGFPSYGGQSYSAKSIGAFLIPYYMLTEGVWYPEGGVAAIPAAFERLARELGVEFRFGTRVTRIESQVGVCKGVTLESGEHVDAEFVICNADRFGVDKLLGREVPKEPSYSYFTVHWGLKNRLTELHHHNLLVPASFARSFEELYGKRFPTEPIVYLNETSRIDPSTAPPGHSNLFAVVTSPAKEPHIDWKASEKEYRSRVVTTLRRFGINPEPTDFEIVQTPLTFEERDASFLGSLYGPDERNRRWGLFQPSVQDEQIKNLFYCGGTIQPGAGLPMVTLSGRFAAEALPR